MSRALGVATIALGLEVARVLATRVPGLELTALLAGGLALCLLAVGLSPDRLGIGTARLGLRLLGGLALTGPVLLRPEFATLTREARYLGFARALEGLRQRLENPLLETTIHTLQINDRLGGRQVSTVLDGLAQAMRAQGRVRAEMRAAQAKQVLAARIVALIPFVVLLVLRTAASGYAAFFATPIGEVWLAGCVASVVAGYWLMRRLGRLPQ